MSPALSQMMGLDIIFQMSEVANWPFDAALIDSVPVPILEFKPADPLT
jgi:hypothetical protein